MESLGLARRELVEEAMLEAERVWMAVLMLEEGVEQMVKKAPPLPLGDKAIFRRLIIFFFFLVDYLGGFPLWFPEDKLFALVGGLGLGGSSAFGWRSALRSGDLHHRVWHGLGARCQPVGSGERP